MNKYSVRAFNDTLGDRPVLMNVYFQSLGRLVIESEDATQRWEWTLEPLQVSKGGANNQLFLLTHPTHPGWMLYVRDYNLVREIQQRYPHKKLPRKHLIDSGFSLAVAMVLVIGLSFAGLYAIKDPVVDSLVQHLPKGYEKKMGQFLINYVVTPAEQQKFAEANRELQQMLSPLLQLGENEGYPFQVFIADSKDLNAFALPGGFLIFNRGLLTAADEAEEIFGVAAHEMAHVTQRHSVRQILSTLGTYAVVQIFLGDVSGVIAILAENSAFLLSRMYSREAEQEADQLAYQYLTEAGIHPRGLVTFFEKLKAHNEKLKEELEKKGVPTTDFPMSFLSTHPTTEERIAQLKTKIDSDISTKKINFKKLEVNLPGFQQKLK